MATNDEMIAPLRERRAALQAEVDAILAQSAPARARLDALHEQQNALAEQAKAATDERRAIEQPRLHDLKMQIGALARAENELKTAGG
ncbi:MAG: hypothetical protein K2X55_02335 [Burkholderiaceae bacterium]|nr:hypothetical protein [Burkholderiaceae bacterium]